MISTNSYLYSTSCFYAGAAMPVQVHGLFMNCTLPITIGDKSFFLLLENNISLLTIYHLYGTECTTNDIAFHFFVNSIIHTISSGTNSNWHMKSLKRKMNSKEHFIILSSLFWLHSGCHVFSINNNNSQPPTKTCIWQPKIKESINSKSSLRTWNVYSSL